MMLPSAKAAFCLLAYGTVFVAARTTKEILKPKQMPNRMRYMFGRASSCFSMRVASGALDLLTGWS